MKQKGFTLIELLVVVAIIGILAAVGIVAFNGFLNSAKVNTVKANHKSVVKFITTELWKCNLGGEIEPYTKWQQQSPDITTYSNWSELENVSCQVANTSITTSNRMKYLTFGLMNYLGNYDTNGFTNPFNPTYDKGTGVGGNHDCPDATNGNTIGETWCNPEPGTTTVHCCSRFGSGIDDIVETYIQNPFIN